jgi:hypothetical protein
VDSVLEHPPATHPHAADAPAGARADAGVVAARWLRISVTRAGRVVVQVCFPSYAVLSLAELVPDDVRTRVIAEHVDLDAIAAAAAARGCPPGDLFAVKAGEHGVRAWLE